MTPLNMARYRNSPHMAFWRMLKQGYDHFEVTRQEPKVDVCDRRYVFDAQSSGNFSPAEQCPAYSVPQEIASAVYNKERQDEAQFAQLVVRGVPTVAATTRGQGGMNATYLAALKASGGPGSDIGHDSELRSPPGRAVSGIKHGNSVQRHFCRTEIRGRLGSIEFARLEASAAGHRAHSEREQSAAGHRAHSERERGAQGPAHDETLAATANTLRSEGSGGPA
jgi:hypothetical protein